MGFEQITKRPWQEATSTTPIILATQHFGLSCGFPSEEAIANGKLAIQAQELYTCLVGYMAAVEQVQAAMQDGVNVQGAVSNIIGWEDRCKWVIQQAGGEIACL